MAGKIKELAVEHLTTSLNIKSFNGCSECPIRLYVKDDECITFGVGNICSTIIIVLPNYDIKAKIGYTTIFKILNDEYNKIYNRDIIEDCYITRLIKCYNKTQFDMNDIAIKQCFVHLYYEICKLNPNKIIFCGNTYDKYINAAKGYRNNLVGRNIINMYNPAVMFYDNVSIKNKFIEQLKQIV